MTHESLLIICQVCQIVKYCSEECKKKDERFHKLDCKPPEAEKKEEKTFNDLQDASDDSDMQML